LEKLICELLNNYDLPILFMGGVASSKFLKKYLLTRFKEKIQFSEEKYASDNALGVAYIGYNNFMEA
jgi:N6-L-threonylcarbamoyladenine synthase